MSTRGIFTDTVQLRAEVQLDIVTPAQYLAAIFVNFDTVPTTSEELEIWYRFTETVDGRQYVYDTLMYQYDPSTATTTDFFYESDIGIPLTDPGEAIEVHYPNTDGRTIAVTLKMTTRL